MMDNDQMAPVPANEAAAHRTDKIVLDLAPEIGRWLLAADSGSVVASVRAAIEGATGTADPDAQVAAMADPDVAGRLRVRLAAIAADSAAAVEAAAHARLSQQIAGLVGHDGSTRFSSASFWGAPVVSLVVLVTFGGVVALTLLRSIPVGAEPVLNVLLGTLGAMATSVVGYWVGSSAGSARKDECLATIAERAGPAS